MSGPPGAGPPVAGPSATALLVQRHLAVPRLGTYIRAAGGDLDRGVELYLWNASVAGALWEALGHGEVVLRNTLHDRVPWSGVGSSRVASRSYCC